MEGFDPATSFGSTVAAHYDDSLHGDEQDAAAFLHSLAAGGSALEFAIGTGRIAIPLMESGTRVDGIELSPEMTEVLRSKAPDVDVTAGDMSTADAPAGPYSLIYLVFNTIANLLTQDDQVRCFENAARHLTDDGVFVIETGTGWGWIKGRHHYVDAEHVGTSSVTLDVNRFDPATQILEENHVTIAPDGIRLAPIVQRIAPPGELDLMARIAGLRLLERYGWWDRRPFDGGCASHISVYGPVSSKTAMP